MTSTVTDAGSVVNPVRAHLGDSMRGLYDWLRSRTAAPGRTRYVEVTPPVARYEQVARQLRERIFSGEFPERSTLPSGPGLADRLGVSQPVVQRAFEVLAREGLVRMESGRGTTVLERQRWLVEFGAQLPVAHADETASLVVSALAGVSRDAASGATAQRSGDGVRLRMTVESADLGGAVIAALRVARSVLGPLPVAAMSVQAA
jgi:GntR family transcriptional regulator